MATRKRKSKHVSVHKSELPSALVPFCCCCCCCFHCLALFAPESIHPPPPPQRCCCVPNRYHPHQPFPHCSQRPLTLILPPRSTTGASLDVSTGPPPPTIALACVRLRTRRNTNTYNTIHRGLPYENCFVIVPPLCKHSLSFAELTARTLRPLSRRCIIPPFLHGVPFNRLNTGTPVARWARAPPCSTYSASSATPCRTASSSPPQRRLLGRSRR